MGAKARLGYRLPVLLAKAAQAVRIHRPIHYVVNRVDLNWNCRLPNLKYSSGWTT